MTKYFCDKCGIEASKNDLINLYKCSKVICVVCYKCHAKFDFEHQNIKDRIMLIEKPFWEKWSIKKENSDERTVDESN